MNTCGSAKAIRQRHATIWYRRGMRGRPRLQMVIKPGKTRHTNLQVNETCCTGLPKMTDHLPTSPAELLARLDEMGFETKTYTHEAVFTVEESEHVTAMFPGGHTKNLFVKDKKDNYFLIVAENHAQLLLNQLHRMIGASSRVSFGKPDKLMEYLGVEPGSVNAFAPLNDTTNRVKVVIDEPLLQYDRINCHPLTNTMTTTISREDLLAFLAAVGHEPLIVKLSGNDDGAGES